MIQCDAIPKCNRLLSSRYAPHRNIHSTLLSDTEKSILASALSKIDGKCAVLSTLKLGQLTVSVQETFYSFRREWGRKVGWPQNPKGTEKKWSPRGTEKSFDWLIFTNRLHCRARHTRLHCNLLICETWFVHVSHLMRDKWLQAHESVTDKPNSQFSTCSGSRDWENFSFCKIWGCLKLPWIGLVFLGVILKRSVHALQTCTERSNDLSWELIGAPNALRGYAVQIWEVQRIRVIQKNLRQ